MSEVPERVHLAATASIAATPMVGRCLAGSLKCAAKLSCAIKKLEVEYWRGHQHPFIPLGGACYGAIPTQTKKSSSDASWGDAPRHESRMCSSSQQNFGRLLSHAEPNYSGCCATFGPGGSLKGSRTFLANGRNKYFAIIASDSISRPFDVTQSACLPRIAFRA